MHLSAGAGRLTPLELPGPAGNLEALLQTREPEEGGLTALVCHPHPRYGGTMHNKVVHAAAGALADAGLPVMRFNFRGAGLSEGRHDAGHGEQEDMRAVLDHLADRYPAAPILVAGYSFGAFVGLKVGCGDGRVAALIGIGLPVTLYDFGFLAASARPLAIIQGDRDRFGPLPLLLAFAATLPGGARVIPVPGAEHAFDGRLEEVAHAVAGAIPSHIIATPPPRPS